METVLLICFSPWQIEMLGAADIPHEKVSQFFSNLFGFIPVNRGHMDRPALNSALNILDQNGIIGIFPEGGIWEPGFMRAQSGTAWLSFRGKLQFYPLVLVEHWEHWKMVSN
jgi:1-acyl-sn-glycerol-3-phosphate acyltransferase